MMGGVEPLPRTISGLATVLIKVAFQRLQGCFLDRKWLPKVPRRLPKQAQKNVKFDLFIFLQDNLL